jgi:hypothetical protein
MTQPLVPTYLAVQNKRKEQKTMQLQLEKQLELLAYLTPIKNY